MPTIVRQLNQWRKRLDGDEFFSIYGQYHETIIDNGIIFGILSINPSLVEEITNLYVNAFLLYSRRLLASRGYYLFHYVNGIPMTVWSSFLLAGEAIKDREVSHMGFILKREFRVTYGFSLRSVRERLDKFADLITKEKPFADDFFPLTEGKVNYVSLADNVFNDYCELKKSFNSGPSPLIGYFRKKHTIKEYLFRASLRDQKYID